MTNKSNSEALVYRPDKVKADVLAMMPSVQAALQACRDYVVNSMTTFEKAGEWLKAAKQGRAEVQIQRDKIVKPSHEAHKEATKFFGQPLKVYDEAIDILTGKMGAWDLEQRRLARQRELEARQKQDEEARRLREEAEAEAAKAEAEGDPELAQEIRSDAELAAVPLAVLPPPVVTQVDGLARRATWKARVVDLDLVPMDYCKKVPNMDILNAFARQTEGRGQVPGVEFYEDVTYAQR